MVRPKLIIFDIDDTLIKPNLYSSKEQIRAGLFDPMLLSGYLNSSNVQVGIASFNIESPDPKWMGGRTLGRAILDLQKDNSQDVVPDDFIQCWRYTNYPDMFKYGKNNHIANIIIAYQQRYNADPPLIIFYDDMIENIYLASQAGVYAYWVTRGLTRTNITSFERIGNRIEFRTEQVLPNLGYFNNTLRKYDHYVLYLPQTIQKAQRMSKEFIERLLSHGIIVKIIAYDLYLF